MCGIVGYIDYKLPVTEQQVEWLNNCLVLRGPDAEGIYVQGNVGLGHRRLSVIDLESGQQPMYSHDKKTVIVFNGEIYNFKSLRTELEQSGAVFTTQSDTEVVLWGYEILGINKLLSKMEGMFAFAIHDQKNDSVFIARDKFGEKPLYYMKNNDGFMFASELKALEPVLQNKTINKEALNLFLSLTYIPAPHTIYKMVHKMMPGTYIKLDLKGSANETRYYNLLDSLKNQEKITDFEAAKATLKTLFTESVQQRMVSDVPLGAFLSGGI
jgi:asparagine synthase (glutamine-hydrolysing)